MALFGAAVCPEKNGVGVFYVDTKKAARYSALSGLVKGSIPSGVIHNINDPGSPVNGVFKKQTETLQFDRYFKGSKVVDQNGDPLVVYHGSDYDPLVQPVGKGVLRPHTMFTSSPEYAKRYGKHVRSYYLAIKHPFDIRNKEDYDIFKEYRGGREPGMRLVALLWWRSR